MCGVYLWTLYPVPWVCISFFVCAKTILSFFVFPLLIYFFTEAELLYNVVLISAVDQSKSAMCMHIYPLRLEPPCFLICICAPYS